MTISAKHKAVLQETHAKSPYWGDGTAVEKLKYYTPYINSKMWMFPCVQLMSMMMIFPTRAQAIPCLFKRMSTLTTKPAPKLKGRRS